jgi:SRSO17 transposase
MPCARILSKWRWNWAKNVRKLQYFVVQSQWKTETVIEIHQRLVAETMGEGDGVALIDESGVVKQENCSLGVAAQYCGAVGKIANSHNGVYLGYASRKGYSLIEGQLFMQESWFDEAYQEPCEACGVPSDLKTKTNRRSGWKC